MATVYKAAGGKPMARYIAGLGIVQKHMDERVFEAAVKAENNLIAARLKPKSMAKATMEAERGGIAHGASIEYETAGIDRLLILVDRAVMAKDLNPRVRNLNTAASIELGREGGSREITVRDPDNPSQLIQKTVKWGATKPLNILARAVGVDSFGKAV